LPQLKVIRASAGSGKTYNLAGEYLRLIFADTDYFRHILAVTFTNKATNEMKGRIVRELDLLASGQSTSHISDLMASTGLPENQLRNKAKIILKKLLHQYSSFSVSTIDSFFQRIIRSFTRELGLQGTYSIELDTESLLTTVIDHLLIEAEKDKSLLTWLGSYAESLIEKGDSWNFRKSIRVLGKEIFREEFKSLSDQIAGQYGNRNFLLQFQQELYTDLHRIEKEYKAFGIQTMAILDASGLILDDFFKKSSGPAGFLLKLASGEFKEPTLTATEAVLSPEKWYTRNSSKAAEIRTLSENQLIPLMQRALDFYNTHHRHFFSLEVVLKNIYTLGIMSDLSQLAYRWCNENNAFLLPEAPLFLQKIIDGNDTPFIYEKVGYWYNHFMIDEFQDTSLLQWLNFKPLISNSLSQGFDNLVVGDVKQSIYRWRNSNWAILARGIGQDFPAGVINNCSLNYNWRSGKKIIEFNNLFFQGAAVTMENEFMNILQREQFPSHSFDSNPVTSLYSDTGQEPGHKDHPEGEIQICFIEEDKKNDFYDQANQKLIVLLRNLQEKGYRQGDIAIITRKNKEAKLLADFLLSYELDNPDTGQRFDVISDEALKLGSSSMVIFLVSLMQYLVDPDNMICSYYILSFYKNHLDAGRNTHKWVCPSNDVVSRKNELAGLLPDRFHRLADSADTLSLVEMVEQLISLFGLTRFTGEQVYLDAFRDLVQEYSQKYAADPAQFLEYWNETGKEKSVAAPAGQEAIRILTIHKSKGLEFSIVIVPYCQWDLNPLNNNILWCKPKETPFNKLGTVPVYYSSRLKKTLFAGDYYTEYLNQYIDNLNLLYVTFTRACDGLYVFCRQGKEDQLKNVSDLACTLLQRKAGEDGSGNKITSFPGNYDEVSASYTYGELPLKDKTAGVIKGENFLPAGVSVEMASKRIQIAYQGKIYLDPAVNRPKRPLNEGRILHEIFNAIRTSDDIIPAVTGMYLHGKINQDEMDTYLSGIPHFLNDLQVLTWFTKDWHILNEAEIILPDGVIKRPDRVMTKNGITLVIDYKFGEKIDPAHGKQIKQYIGLLQQMGYTCVDGYLWYVMLGKVIMINDE
jgi:ATP-dependent helicase/nuclease subunit A